MKASTKNNEDETKTVVIGVRFSAAELRAIQACADESGHKLSAWVRWAAVTTARVKRGTRRR